MKKNIYTLVITKYGTPISRDFTKRAAIEEAIAKLFGKASADAVSKWIDGAAFDCTYNGEGFYIHYLANV